MNDIRRIGIIGAGQMGRGIAHVCARRGSMSC
jgi:3-hydroxyacyl-CoA dehydrogenase